MGIFFITEFHFIPAVVALTFFIGNFRVSACLLITTWLIGFCPGSLFPFRTYSLTRGKAWSITAFNTVDWIIVVFYIAIIYCIALFFLVDSWSVLTPTVVSFDIDNCFFTTIIGSSFENGFFSHLLVCHLLQIARSLCQKSFTSLLVAFSCPSDLRLIVKWFSDPFIGLLVHLDTKSPTICLVFPRTIHLGHILQKTLLSVSFKFQEDTKSETTCFGFFFKVKSTVAFPLASTVKPSFSNKAGFYHCHFEQLKLVGCNELLFFADSYCSLLFFLFNCFPFWSDFFLIHSV